MKEHFELGSVLKPQGIKGEIKLKPYSGDLSRFNTLEKIYIKIGDVYSETAVLSARTYKQFAYIYIEGCTDRNTAETYRNKIFYIKREDAPPLEEGEFYLADLEKLELHDQNGSLLGVVDNVMNTGAADIYIISGDNPFMFAAAPGVILSVDAYKIVVDSVRLAEVAVYD